MPCPALRQLNPVRQHTAVRNLRSIRRARILAEHLQPKLQLTAIFPPAAVRLRAGVENILQGGISASKVAAEARDPFRARRDYGFRFLRIAEKASGGIAITTHLHTSPSPIGPIENPPAEWRARTDPYAARREVDLVALGLGAAEHGK